MNEYDNLCPECEGEGWVWIYTGWFEKDRCPVCDGTGKIATIPAEEEAGEYDPWEADEYERWLDSL